VDVLRKEIAAATERIETLETESPLGSRMEISVDAGVPTAPFRDTRIKTAAAGAVAGGMVPLSLLLAFGLCRRRYRYADEAESDFTRVVPMLGVIPDLLDRQTGADAAHCVHRVRAVLQARAAGHQPRAYLLTSAVAGEGKTSFTSALGLSFAAAGCRTLVIDCDLVGRRLTQCFNARDGRGLVAVLAGAGLIGLAVQRGEGLWVLPAGTETGGESSAISAPAIRRLLAEAKAHFDVVLMDTGPVLGSVEALVAASECDGAILVVARGQDPNLVRRAMKNLESVHGKTLGFVFNRAHYGDFRGSASASSQRSVAAEAPAWRSRAPRFVPVDGAAHPSFSDMAPLAQAVASNAGGSRNSGTAA
jgi:capsular exopolysaccharide synthesis family protein